MKNDDELLDLVDGNDKVIGTVWKSEAHKDPTKIHREVAVAVFNKRGEVLIQQRSLSKKKDPGAWKITAAGHVDAGEDPKDAIEREVLGELGLKVDALFLDKEFIKREGKLGYREARFAYVYYAVLDNDVELKLDKKEVGDAKWISPDELGDFAKDNDWDVTGLSHKAIMEAKDIAMVKIKE